MVLLDTAMLHQVRWIRKGIGTAPHQRLTHIGGGMAANAWLLSVEQAIEGMEEGRWCFCVLQDGHFLPVVIALSASGQKYLKTTADGDQPDHLLILPEVQSATVGPTAEQLTGLPC